MLFVMSSLLLVLHIRMRISSTTHRVGICWVVGGLVVLLGVVGLLLLVVGIVLLMLLLLPKTVTHPTIVPIRSYHIVGIVHIASTAAT